MRLLHLKKQPAPRHSWILIGVLLGLLLAAPAPALQTQEVEFGENGAYDGSVKIACDEQGRMTLTDHDVAQPVTLSDLRYSGKDHHLLLGLEGDDHPQYLNSARHTAGHTAAFNGALATPADVNGNQSLQGHLLDSGIHLKRAGAETISGNWLFSGLPEFFSGFHLSHAGLAGNVSITFKDDPQDAEILWNDTANRFDLNRPISINSAGNLSMGGTEVISNARAAILTQADVDNLRLDGNAITSTNANGNLALVPNGTGKVNFGSAAPVYPGGFMTIYDNRPVPTDGTSNLTLSNTNDDGFVIKLMSVKPGYAENEGNLRAAIYLRSYMADPNNDSGTFQIRGNNDSSVVVATFSAENGGRVGIGTDVPGDKLTVSGGNLNLATGALKTNNVTRIDNSGVASLASLTLNGQKMLNEINLLDNPDFTLWQRNTSQNCAAGGNTGGTLTYPVPGTLNTGADRWQVSRAKTDMASTISQTTLPAPLSTALSCLKNEVSTGGPTCSQYIHQTLPRELTAGLRGKWVTFAISHYMNGTTGGNIAIYKTVGGVPTELTRYSFTSTANTWERLAISAQVPTDAETLLVSIQSNLSTAGPTVAYLANAVLLEGKYVSAPEKVINPPDSSVPPMPKAPGRDLENCQRYFERGFVSTTGYAPNTAVNHYICTVNYNTAKSSASTITISNFQYGSLQSATCATTERPAYVPAQSWPQGFKFDASGSLSAAGLVYVSADWTASCPEPI